MIPPRLEVILDNCCLVLILGSTTEQRRTVSELLLSRFLLLFCSFLLFLFLFNLLLKLAAFTSLSNLKFRDLEINWSTINYYLSLEEVFGSTHSHLVDIDLGEGGELAEAGLQVQLPRRGLPEDQ